MDEAIIVFSPPIGAKIISRTPSTMQICTRNLFKVRQRRIKAITGKMRSTKITYPIYPPGPAEPSGFNKYKPDDARKLHKKM